MARISQGIGSQLDPTIRKSYPRFVEFLEAYYEWLQQEGNPYGHMKDHFKYLDFTKSLDSYVDQMKNEYLHNIPKEIVGDPELFIKYSSQFNSTIGTEKSFNFIFNILYGEDVEIYYPKNDIFRLSDGKWVTNENVLYVTLFQNPERFINRRVVQKREVTANVFEYAYATVIRVKSRYVRGWKFAELTVVDIEGEFDYDFPVYVEGEAVPQLEYFVPASTDYEVVDGGSGYQVGDVLQHNTVEEYQLTGTITVANEFNTKLTTNFNESDISVLINGLPVDPSDFEFDGTMVTFSTPVLVGDSVQVSYPQYTGFFVVNAVDVNNSNAIQLIDIIEPIIGINAGPGIPLDSSGGTGADVTVTQGTTKEVAGYYLNDDGWLSSTKVLQDGFFYQEYSYVIRSTRAIDEYRDIVEKVLHPAGMKFFGEINLTLLIELMIRDVYFDITVKIPEIMIESYAALGPTTSFLDRTKNYFDAGSVTVENYKDVVVADIATTPLKKYDAQDVKHRFIS